MFFIPPGVAYFIYEKYSVNSGATLAFTAVMAAIWVFAVVVSYYAGQKQDRKG